MKAFILSVLLMISMPLMAMDACFTGSWYSPDRSGEGITLEVLDNKTVGYFYTYGSEGRAWYALVEGDSENILTMYGTAKVSEIPFSVSTFDVGTASITAIDSDTLKFSYSLVIDIDNVDVNPWCLSGFCKGDYKYARLTQPIPCE